MLESLCHSQNAMATLTYAEDPITLVPEDLQLFMRRLRRIYPAPIRFFGVGEYGDLRGRPHYHVALFGLSIMDGEYISKAWSDERGLIGNIHMAELNNLTAQYICGYVTKKMNKRDDVRLEGRHPEFARMSLRPGIGAPAIKVLKNSVAPNGDVTLMKARGDVPESIRSAGKMYPLGRYLRGKLRESIGWEPTQPQEHGRAITAAYLSRTPEEIAAHEAKREQDYTRAETRLKLDKGKKRL